VSDRPQVAHGAQALRYGAGTEASECYGHRHVARSLIVNWATLFLDGTLDRIRALYTVGPKNFVSRAIELNRQSPVFLQDRTNSFHRR